ncbi:sulfotransferase domain-containing protein [Actibacterium pelagium]|uniref:Sulfotransferase n=1 Tax=Actibacterium pelagium TaxID=2029103 RepID=A0A917EHN7_9RHOB|nr:sulfotransferase domain-containing protein [Actibacterium pelagium]GGE36353.1 sulfotransferase [Actibacterium pelagium]
MAFDAKNAAPDFFVVGAAKAGTTAVWSWLRQHPGVFLPDIKEPSFFAFEGRSTTPRNGPYDKDYVRRLFNSREQYAALFAEADGKVSGDVSPVYLSDERAPNRIARARPDARILILLRDPVDRAYSQYMHHRRDGLEPCATFEAALKAEASRIEDGWSWGHGYLKGGQYASQVATYLKLFEPSQILILDYAQLQEDPVLCWQQICRHFRVSQLPMPQNDRVNQTANLRGVPRFQLIERIIRHPGRVQQRLKALIPETLRRRTRSLLSRWTAAVEPMAPQTRDKLAVQFASDRDWLRKNTDLHLSEWSD